MKHFFKATAVVAGVLIVIWIIDLLIHIACSKNGIELNATAISMVLTFIGVFSGILLYDRWIKNEK